MKKLDLEPRSFEKTRAFPGSTGNPFDRVLYGLLRIDKIPTIIIFFILGAYALAGSLPQILEEKTTLTRWGVTFFSFLLLDWAMLFFLPVLRISFGPVKTVLLMLASLRLPFAFLPPPFNIVMQILGTLMVFFGFYFEPFQINVNHERLSLKGFSSKKTLRLLHLGDLHIERTTIREKKLIKKIHELAPDLILFSGDVLNLSYLTDETAKADAISFFNQLKAPYGVFGVLGSPAVDSADLFAMLAEQTPFVWLKDDIQTLSTGAGKINLVGLTCSHNPDQDEKKLAALELPTEGVTILLYHSPDLAPNASRYPIDLQLSGHTHAGQIRLPLFGAFFTGSLYGRIFESGRYLVNGLPLYITSGLGMEGAAAPRVRFFARPELILWELSG